MATLKILVPNVGGEYSLVNVRVTHNRRHKFINTKKYIRTSSLEKSGSVPQDFILDNMLEDYKLYRDRLNAITNIDSLSVDQVAKIVEFGPQIIDAKHIKENTSFTGFCWERLEGFKKKSDKREAGTISGYGLAIKKIEKFLGADCKVSAITTKSVAAWLNWMLDDEDMEVGTAKNYYYKIKKLYKDLMKHLNDPDNDHFVLMYNPFDSVTPKTEKKKKRPLLTLDQLRSVRDCQTLNFYAGRNFFMLSLYLCGATYADIYDNVEKWISNGERAEYERRKTRNKREDSAFISICITPEVMILLEDFKRYKEYYAGYRCYQDRIALETKHLQKWLDIDVHIVPYTARYMFSNIASDECDMRDDYVARAMNHKQPELSETTGYLHSHWRKIDEVQRAVIDKINEDIQ